MRRVDLNADVGESVGSHVIGDDEGVIAQVSSASIAAGFHGGDPSVLRATIRRARERHVAVGAHPGYPDLPGFGRRELNLGAAEVEDLVLYQIAAVRGVAAAEGVSLRHVKAHGALYNSAVKSRPLAEAIVRAVAAIDPGLILFAPGASEMALAARHAGLAVAAEAFADRAYEADGTLVPRSRAGSVIEDPSEVLTRALRMVVEGVVIAVNGTEVPVQADTICVHGDTPGAAVLARQLRAHLERAGVSVRPPGA